MCYPPEEHEESCPITQILFVKYDTIDKYRNNPAYTIQSFYEDDEWTYLVYSKTVVNSLPITTTSVQENRPCMDPDEISDVGSNYYPLEKDRLVPRCHVDYYSGMLDDVRYEFTGGQVDEYQV